MFSIEGLQLEIGADWSDVALAFHQIEEATEDLRRDVARLSHAMTGATVAATGLATSAAAIGTAVAAGAAGAAGGFATIGIIASATKEDIQNTYKGLGQEISATFQSISGPIDEALTHVAAVASGLLGTLKGDFAEAFQVVAPWIETAANSLSRFAQVVMPAAISITKAAAPVVDALSRSMDHLAGGLAGFMQGLEQGMGGAATTAEAVFKSLSDVFVVLGDVMGSIAKASSTIGPAFASLFTELMTVTLRFLEGAIVPLMPEITAIVEGFTSFMQAIRESIGPVAAFTATVVPLIGLVAALWSRLNPAVAVVTALAGVAVTLHNNWSRITSFLEGEFPQAFTVAGALLRSFLATGKEVFGTLISVARPVLQDLVEFVQVALGEMERQLTVWGPAIEVVWSNVFGALVETMEFFMKVIGKEMQMFLNILSGDWEEAWQNLVDRQKMIFGAGLNWLIESLADTLKKSIALLNVFASALGKVSSEGKLLSAALAGAFSNVDAVASNFLIDPAAGRENGKAFGEEFASGISEALSTAFAGGGGVGVPTGDVPNVGFAAPVAAGLRKMEGFVPQLKSIAAQIKQTLRGMAAPEVNPFEGLAMHLGTTVEEVKSLAPQVRDALMQIPDATLKMAGVMQGTFQRVRGVMRGFLGDVLKQLGSGMGKMFAQAFGAMTTQQKRLKQQIQSTQEQLTTALAKGASEQVARLKEQLSGLRQEFEHSQVGLMDIGRNIIKTLASALQKIGGILITAGTAFAALGGPAGLIAAIVANPLAAVGAGLALTGIGAAINMAMSSPPAPVGGGSTVAGRGGSSIGRGESPYGREPIGNSGGGRGTLEARIEGTDLVFLLEETKRRQGR